MIYIIGLGVSLVILCLIIYLHPIFSNKWSVLNLVGLTTFSFILSSVMGMVYSFFIGFIIFLLLIGSLALLIGKKRDWLELSDHRDLGTSRRSRYKEAYKDEGLVLQSIITVNDHQLFRKTADKSYPVTPIKVEMQTSDEAFKLDDYDSYKEIAATSEMSYLDVNHTSDDIINEEIYTYDTIQLETNDTEHNEHKQTEGLEELTDQWMKKRVHSMFERIEDPPSVKTAANKELTNVEFDSYRYEDLSDSYFKEVRSEEIEKS